MRVKALPSLAFLLLLLLLLAGCGGGGPPESVPDLRGLRLDVAERRLDGLGLDYERVGGGALGVVVDSRWRVCDQEPRPGVEAEKVTLIVDRSCPAPAPELHVVPSLVGLRVWRAESLLERRGLAYDAGGYFGEATVLRTWTVCEQQPSAGQRAARVSILAARECDARPTPPLPVVPAVTGEDLDDAEAVLEGAGISYSVFPGEPDRGAFRLWEVCEQDPQPGEPGAHVDLYVARRCGD